MTHSVHNARFLAGDGVRGGQLVRVHVMVVVVRVVMGRGGRDVGWSRGGGGGVVVVRRRRRARGEFGFFLHALLEVDLKQVENEFLVKLNPLFMVINQKFFNYEATVTVKRRH